FGEDGTIRVAPDDVALRRKVQPPSGNGWLGYLKVLRERILVSQVVPVGRRLLAVEAECTPPHFHRGGRLVELPRINIWRVSKNHAERWVALSVGTGPCQPLVPWLPITSDHRKKRPPTLLLAFL